MEEKELTSKTENAAEKVSETTQPVVNSAEDHDKINPDEKDEACSNDAFTDKKKADFRETAKYCDGESFASQHHHSIGTGLFMTDEIRDLPPRYRTKVMKALENALALYNVHLDRNPLEYFSSNPEDSKIEEKNEDSLVYISPELLENEKKRQKSEYVFRPPSRGSLTSSESLNANPSNCDSNPSDFRGKKQPLYHKTQVSSNTFSRNKSESHFSNNFTQTDLYKRHNSYNKELLSSQDDAQSSSGYQSDSYQSKAKNKASRVQSHNHPKFLPLNDFCQPHPKVNNNVPTDVLSQSTLGDSHSAFSKASQEVIDYYNPIIEGANLPPSENVLASYDFRKEIGDKNESSDLKIHKSSPSLGQTTGSVNQENKPDKANLRKWFPDLKDNQKISLSGNSFKNFDNEKIRSGKLSPDANKVNKSEYDKNNYRRKRESSFNSQNSANSETRYSTKGPNKSKYSDSEYRERNNHSRGRKFDRPAKVPHSDIEISERTNNIHSSKEAVLNSFENTDTRLQEQSNNTVAHGTPSQENQLRKENLSFPKNERHNYDQNLKFSSQEKCKNTSGPKYFTREHGKNRHLDDADHNEKNFNHTKERKAVQSSEESRGNLEISDRRHCVHSSKESLPYSPKFENKRLLEQNRNKESNPLKKGNIINATNFSNSEKHYDSNQSLKFSSQEECSLKNDSKPNKKYTAKEPFKDNYSDIECHKNFNQRMKFNKSRKEINKNLDATERTSNLDLSRETPKRLQQLSHSEESNQYKRGNTKMAANYPKNKKQKDSDCSLEFSSQEYKRENKLCLESGFFIKVGVSEKSSDIKYWVEFFKSLFSFEIELQRCCRFSDMLILEFDSKEHALKGRQLLRQQKRKMQNFKTPSLVSITTLLNSLEKPCKCKNKIIGGCIKSLINHFESCLQVVTSKIEEIQSSKADNKKSNSRHKTFSAANKMVKMYEESLANFTQIKHATLNKVKDAENLITIQKLKHSFIRECNSFKRCLPIYSKKSEILHSVRFHNVTVVVAETGSGKSTQLVEYLLHSDVSNQGRIICTQPRKLAAISIAQFVSGQIGSGIGKIVGYDVGIEKKQSEDTKIIYMTDYCVLKMFLQNRELKGVSCIIIDEAHERSLYTDLILGLLKQCLKRRPDLSVIITSATINPTIFVNYFNMPDDCVIEVPGRSYPVDVIWLPNDVEIVWDYLDACVRKAYEIHKHKKEGDILVFLTSPSESDEAIYLFKRLLSNKDEVPQLLCLHGKSDIHEQMQIFQNTVKTSRKIVFATNVAETAVTIPGIKYVIDSGMTKELMFDPKNNKSYLAVTFITKSAAEQRKGRAGRTQAGVCYRMYSERNYEDMPDNAVPEVLKTNLQKALLKIFELGIDPANFDFIEAPPKVTISNSIDSLEHLGAIKDKKLTDFGKKVVKLPVEPQLSKLILQGIKAGIGYETVVIAALVSESAKLFIRNEDNKEIADEKKRKFCQTGGDLCTYLEIYKRWKEVDRSERFNWCVENYISSKALNAAAKTVKEIMFSLHTELNIRVSTRYNNSDFKKHYEKVLFDSFSENLCVLSGHPKLGYLSPFLPESFFIHPSSTLSYLGKDLPEFLVYSTLMETSRNFLFDVTPISEATIKLANQTNNFQLPLHSLKCLQVPPKILGPFGESVLIRYILGKKGSKIKELEMKIQDFTKTKNVYVDVAVDKGLITVYLSQRFHDKVSNHISQIIMNAHTEMLNEEDVIKLSGTSMHFALSAGGMINDIVMPGEFRELILNNVHPKSRNDLKKVLESYGPLQRLSDITSNKKESQLCVTFKTVSDAQKAFKDLRKKKMYDVSSKPYLLYNDKTSPLHILHISWCCHPCTGYGSVEFHSEEDLIVASGILTCNSFYLDNNLVIFSPSEKYEKELSMKNLPKTAEERSISAELSKSLPSDVKVKKIEIFRNLRKITDACINETKQKLSKLLNQYISSTKFVIDLKDPRKEASWNAFVYVEKNEDAEKLLVKLKNKTSIDSYPLTVKQVFKSSVYCTKEVYEAVSSQINSILADKKAKKLCNDFSIKKLEKKFSVCVEFDCISFEELNDTRKSLSQFLRGESLNFFGMPKYHFLFSNGHAEQIEQIKKSTNTFINVDKIKKIITLYGSSENCQKAQEAIYSIVSNPDYSYTRTFNLKESCIPKGFMKKLYMTYGYHLHGLIDEFKLTVASIDNFGQTLTLKGLKNAIKKAEQEIEKLCEELYESRGQRGKTSCEEEVCPICFDPVSYDFYRLEHCGHAFCRQCLLLQIESKTMPLVCVKQNCGKLIFLEDIKRIMSMGGNQLKKVFCAVALQYHVNCNLGKLSYCPTPDCQMIYRVTSEGSEFNCPGCQNSVCTRCQCPYHYGMSCEMYQNCQKDVDYSLTAWVKQNESDRKYCPSCKTVIEKNGGCNHMECLNCKVHLCWLCLQIFRTEAEVYNHMPYCPNNQ